MTSYPDIDKYDGRTMLVALFLIVVFAVWLAMRAVKGGKGDE